MLVEPWPPKGSPEPMNAAVVLMRFDGPVTEIEAAVSLTSGSGKARVRISWGERRRSPGQFLRPCGGLASDGHRPRSQTDRHCPGPVYPASLSGPPCPE